MEKARVSTDTILKTILMKFYTATGEGSKAVAIWKELHRGESTLKVDSQLLSTTLSACAEVLDLEVGREGEREREERGREGGRRERGRERERKRIHREIIKSGALHKGQQNKLFLSAALINMYSKWGVEHCRNGIL
jgi:hypothetical protein